MIDQILKWGCGMKTILAGLGLYSSVVSTETKGHKPVRNGTEDFLQHELVPFAISQAQASISEFPRKMVSDETSELPATGSN
jgi:hypothetical protein